MSYGVQSYGCCGCPVHHQAKNNPAGLTWPQTGLALGVGVGGALAINAVANSDAFQRANVDPKVGYVAMTAIFYTIGVVLGSSVASAPKP